jgi:hypothetical protein
MFGQVSFASHPDKDKILNAISKRVKHSQKLRSPSLLTKGKTICTPRFGGRTVFLWVKNKTRVWADRNNVWKTLAKFPTEFISGTLLQAEMYRDIPTGDDKGKWIIAFEDVIIHNGIDLTETAPFTQRLRVLTNLIISLRRYSETSLDPGIFTVKPWYKCSEVTKYINSDKFRKRPEYLLIRFLQKDIFSKKPDTSLSRAPFFMKIQYDNTSSAHTSDNIRLLITKDTKTIDPDQYILTDSKGESKGKACVKTLHNSLWLRSLSDGTEVLCRWNKIHKRYEPYSSVPTHL